MVKSRVISQEKEENWRMKEPGILLTPKTPGASNSGLKQAFAIPRAG